MSLAPVFFISHGAPTFALEPGILGAALRRHGPLLDGMRAILVVSPHWQTPELRIGTHARPPTIHDFGGFPEPLYALQYPAPGAPAIAGEIAALLESAGLSVIREAQRGLDHGVWVPLLHLRPQADIPVIPLSMPLALDATSALALGRVLAALRSLGIAVIGSGSLTHNLRDVFAGGGREPGYAPVFVDWIRDVIRQRDDRALVEYRQRAPYGERAHPTDEHLLPLMVAFGASAGSDELSVLEGGMTYVILSMESYLWQGSAPTA